MAKYKLKSLSVNLGGRVVRKTETPEIDGNKFPATDIAAAEKGGFIEKVKEKKAEPKAETKAKQQSSNTKKKAE
jgi:hypothetical protein